MTVKKFQLAPGVNRENTRYAAGGTWYETDKVRFRLGYPQKIGGWQRVSSETYLGVARSLWNWSTLTGQNLVAVGTNLKYYIERGGAYYDVTPIRLTTAAGDVTFSAANGSAVITVTNVDHGAQQGDYVTFSDAASLGGNITAIVLNQEYVIASIIDDDNYTFTATATANASDIGNGGASVIAAYQIPIGNEAEVPFTGWSAGRFGFGTWGFGGVTVSPMRLWSQTNFGEDLFFTYRGGQLFYWDATNGVTSRATYVSAIPGAASVPVVANIAFVSDVSRFAFCFGVNDYSNSVLDPMLVRWSDQEDISNWAPEPTNQAGSLRVSHGTQIIAVEQARQEILVWTDSAIYGLQFLGAPDVWGAQLLGDNITIVSPNAMVYSNNVSYWMGKDKFYYYDGTVKTLPCTVRSYVFDDINKSQLNQVVCGTIEQYDEIWWFYPSAGSNENDRYVVFNYLDNIWYYGSLRRSAWLDSDLRDYPIAATYSNNLVYHEYGIDCNELGTTNPITATVVSGEVDLDDGDHFMLINRILPDVTFQGSTADTPSVEMTLLPLQNSGSGYYNPLSTGGNSANTVSRVTTVPIEEFTGQIYVRIRGRQIAFKVESTALGVSWKLGATRLDMKPSGRRG
jgi:hypothetical protein